MYQVYTSCTSYSTGGGAHSYSCMCTVCHVYNVTSFTSYKLQVTIVTSYKLPVQVTRFFCLFTKYT